MPGFLIAFLSLRRAAKRQFLRRRQDLRALKSIAFQGAVRSEAKAP